MDRHRMKYVHTLSQLILKIQYKISNMNITDKCIKISQKGFSQCIELFISAQKIIFKWISVL